MNRREFAAASALAGGMARRAWSAAGALETANPPQLRFEPADAAQVRVGGIAGKTMEASRNGRLKRFIEGPSSLPIQVFGPGMRMKNTQGDWNGEHAGKWLITAARAAYRSGDAELRRNVLAVARYLVSTQEPDGYLGTYAPEARFTSDAAYRKVRTWDVWVHAYIVLGLLEVNRYWPDPEYVRAARRIGDLCLRVLTEGKKSAAWLGNHLGSSGTILLEPAVELYWVTGDPRYLDLAKLVLRQADERPDLELFSRMRRGLDVSKAGDGKIYQLLWNYVGLAKLYRATGDTDFLPMLQHVWKCTREAHLTPGGGPWGGVGGDFENFDVPSFFSPYGFVEVCSIMSWIHLNRELLAITGEPVYAEEIERSLYNDLLAAMNPGGEDWCYYVHPNGNLEYTYYWACCKSSGALALEEIAPLVAGRMGQGIAINFHGPWEAAVSLPAAGAVALTSTTTYPFDGSIQIEVRPEKEARFPLFIRVPAWAGGATIACNREELSQAVPGQYHRLDRLWKAGDRIRLTLPMSPRLLRAASVVQQQKKEYFRLDYAAMVRGPLVYATGLIDGFKREETLKWPSKPATELFTPAPAPAGAEGPAFRLNLEYRSPLLFQPYYEAGGRRNGVWRLLWLQVLNDGA
jgi:uncharacterized protein